MSKYEDNRKKYAQLRYYGFEMEEAPAIGDIPAKLTITYDFEIPGYAVFSPQWDIPCGREDMASDEKIIDLIFQLGMAELLQCYKTVCPKEVVIEPFLLSKEQIKGYKKRWFCALQDFYTANHIDENEDHFVNILCEGTDMIQESLENAEVCKDQLVPIQQKTDQEFDLEKLDGSFEKTICFIVNATEEMIEKVQRRGCERIISVCRSWSEHKLTVDTDDCLYGVVDLSESIRAAALLVAYLYDLKMADEVI